MRKITREATDAFLAGTPFAKQNMQVEVRPWQQTPFPRNQVILKLHGNPIARYDEGDHNLRTLMVCDGNWQTVTTKDRLNALPGVRVYQAKGQWFLNGEAWDGHWTQVTPQFTLHSDPLDKKPRWRVDFPANLKPRPDSLYFATEAAAVAFIGVEEARMGLRGAA